MTRTSVWVVNNPRGIAQGISIGMVVFLLANSILLAQQPILRWSFDEESGDALDTGAGTPANGMFLADTKRTTNTPGGFSKFALDVSEPGLDSWLNGGDAAKVDTLTQFTMTTWLFLKGLNSEQDGSGNVRLLAKQGPDPNFDGFSWNLNNPVDGERGIDSFRFGMFIGGEDGFGFGQSTEPLGADNKWVFAAVTYDGTNDLDNMSFYVGDETTEVTQLGEPLSVFAGQVNSTAGIATVNVGYTDAAPGNDFAADGFQDDVRIYDRVLLLEEINRIREDNLLPFVAGDFNGDEVLDADDINRLTDEVRAETNRSLFDVNNDNVVDQTDRTIWIQELRVTFFGDSNLDGVFSSTDFVAVFQAGEYEDDIPGNSKWETGDWNGDGEFDSSDFVIAFQDGGFEIGPREAVLSVPEPSAIVLTVLALFWLVLRRGTGQEISRIRL